MTNEGEESVIRLPLPGSYMYKFYKDSQFRKKNIKRFKLVNKIVVPLYRLRILPLFGLGRIFLLLIVKGRKTGRTIRVPIEYFRHDGKIYVFPSRGKKSQWLKNMLARPDEVKIQLGFRTIAVKPRLIEDDDVKETILKNYLIKRKRAAKTFFGWDSKKHPLDKVDFSEIKEKLPIVELEPR